MHEEEEPRHLSTFLPVVLYGILRYYALFFICMCRIKSRLLLEIDFSEVRLELSAIVNIRV